MNLPDTLQTISRFFSSSSGAGFAGDTPEWIGWLVLGTLLAAFGSLVWWLYGSPIGQSSASAQTAAMSPRARRVLAGLVLFSGVLFTAGARWDEFWHRLYGGFADDFLWPPHLMIYGSLGLNSAFAGFGLAMAARGSGGIRERFRANPSVGLLGLLAAYQLASIPSDLLWHKIIGPDISAWSLPHFLLMVTSSAVLLIGVSLLLSTRPRGAWRGLGGLGIGEIATLALLVVSTLALLQFGVTEWEWNESVALPFHRAEWVYPVVVLAIGAVEAQLTLFTLRRVGAATIVAIAAALIQWAFVAVARAALPPGPHLAAHVLLVLPALILDGWYALRLRNAADWSTVAIGAIAYGVVGSLEISLAVGQLFLYPRLRPADIVTIVGLGTGVALALGFLARATAIGLTGRTAMGDPSVKPDSLVRTRERHLVPTK